MSQLLEPVKNGVKYSELEFRASYTDYVTAKLCMHVKLDLRFIVNAELQVNQRVFRFM